MRSKKERYSDFIIMIVQHIYDFEEFEKVNIEEYLEKELRSRKMMRRIKKEKNYKTLYQDYGKKSWERIKP